MSPFRDQSPRDQSPYRDMPTVKYLPPTPIESSTSGGYMRRRGADEEGGGLEMQMNPMNPMNPVDVGFAH